MLAALALLSAAQFSRADETIRLANASKKYDLEVRVKECGGGEQDGDPNTCAGPARVNLYRKGAKTPFQVLRMPNVEIYRDTLAHNPSMSEKPRGLYAEEYGFVFDDFNFDGEEDLAVCNGRNGGYGGPSYTVFIFDRRAGKFAESRSLSRLAEGVYLGLFFVEKKERRLVAFSKSGCCYHETEKYKMVHNRPVLVEKITEQSSSGDDPKYYEVLVTTRRLVNGRWVKRTRKEKIAKEEN